MPNRRNVRKRRADSDEEESIEGEGGSDELSLREKLEATRDLQRARQRLQGTAADNLAGTNPAVQLSESNDDEILGGYVKEQKREDGKIIDPERERYIQEQLDKRLGRKKKENEAQASKNLNENDLYAIPKALQAQRTDQEDVSAWMTGIVEVPLSVAHQMKNIEATEAAKKQLLNASDDKAFGLQNGGGPDSELRRITYPLRFGKQTNKEEAWRQEVLQRSPQPKNWKKKR